MIFELYVVIGFIGGVTLLYAVFVRDEYNYTNIISGFISSIIFIAMGFQAYSGIEFQYVIETATFSGGAVTSIIQDVELTTYQFGWLGMLFIIAGVLTTLYNIVVAIEANKKMIEDLEKNSVFN